MGKRKKKKKTWLIKKPELSPKIEPTPFGKIKQTNKNVPWQFCESSTVFCSFKKMQMKNYVIVHENPLDD